MLLIHAISIFVLVAASAYVGSRYGSRGLKAVKDELSQIEKDAANDEKTIRITVYRLVDRIRQHV